MHKKLFVGGSMVALLGLVAAGAAAVGQVQPKAVAGVDPDRLVPAVNQQPAANWKALPAGGPAVQLAWGNMRVNSDATNEPQNEPFVAVDPHNPKHLVVGANNWQAGNGSFQVTAYTSFDAGKSWTTSNPYIAPNASRLNAADATVAFGRDGAVYFAFVAFNPAAGAVAVSRSTDGGLTWAGQNWASSFTSEAADKPALVAGNGSLNLFYQGAGLYTRTSLDNGATWSASTLLDAAGRNAAPVVDAQGAVSVFYVAGNTIKLARNLDLNSGNFRTSTVATTTPLQPRATQYRAGIYPVAGIAPNGTMYVAWADGRNAGHGNDIMFTRSLPLGSSDGKQAWQAPVAVNTDSGNADQLMPALTVAADGAVTVSWLDNRNDAANVNYDIYATQAADGKHFGPNVRVTTQSSNPANDPRLQGTMIGDYIGLAAGVNGVYAVWTDTRNNNEDIFAAPLANTDLR
ncbi:MAG: glycoside hydrolase [Chloroflexota bacterium]|nr:glycoside hydrolase [Chloroflexota bacterium]